MTSFFYVGLGEAFCTMGAADTVRMHMILDVIRIRDDGKMNAVMAFLCTLLLSGGFAKVSDGTLWEGQIALYFRWTCLPDCAVPELEADYRRNNRRLS